MNRDIGIRKGQWFYGLSLNWDPDEPQNTFFAIEVARFGLGVAMFDPPIRAPKWLPAWVPIPYFTTGISPYCK